MPKLYFYDTGLACALMGIDSAKELSTSSTRGAMFETFVVGELMKHYFNKGKRPPLYFWRDNIGTEVDLVLEQGQALAGIEIKSGSRVASDAFGSLRKWQRYAGALETHLGVVYGGDEAFQREEVSILPWGDL